MEKRKNTKILIAGLVTLTVFILWTVIVKVVDVKSIGPNGSSVGLATLNGFVHNLTGVHMALYNITDWLSLVPVCFVFAFAVYGLVQLIMRKSIKKVDADILILGGFYIVVMAVFVFFEYCVINYRPVLINGVLEASYPSSTTLLVMCVTISAVMVLGSRIPNRVVRKSASYVLLVFTVFMVVSRLISGVHWISDIIGGVILSAGLLMIFYSLIHIVKHR